MNKVKLTLLAAVVCGFLEPLSGSVLVTSTITNPSVGVYRYEYTLTADPNYNIFSFSIIGMFDLPSMSLAPAGWYVFPSVGEVDWIPQTQANEIPAGGSLAGFALISPGAPVTVQTTAFLDDPVSGLFAGTDLGSTLGPGPVGSPVASPEADSKTIFLIGLGCLITTYAAREKWRSYRCRRGQ